jgi:hypothetical protein
MFFSFHHLGPLSGPKLFKKKFSCRDCLYIGAAFAEESISVRAGISRSRGGAKGCGTYSSTDVLDFLLTQGTSASAKQYPVQVIHVFLLSLLLSPLSGPKASNKKFHGCRAGIKKTWRHKAPLCFSK